MLGAAPTKEENPPSTMPEVVATPTRLKARRVVPAKEPIRYAGLEVGITSTKVKRVHSREDSDCGLYSDGSNEMEDKNKSKEETHEDIPESAVDNPTTDTEADEGSGDHSDVNLPDLTTDSPDMVIR